MHCFQFFFLPGINNWTSSGHSFHTQSSQMRGAPSLSPFHLSISLSLRSGICCYYQHRAPRIRRLQSPPRVGRLLYSPTMVPITIDRTVRSHYLLAERYPICRTMASQEAQENCCRSSNRFQTPPPSLLQPPLRAHSCQVPHKRRR